MKHELDILLSHKDVIITYDHLRMMVNYSRNDLHESCVVRLDKPLDYIQYYHDTGNLIIRDVDGGHRLFLLRHKSVLETVIESHERVSLIHEDYVVAEGDDETRVWRIRDNKMMPLVFEKAFICQEYLANDRYVIQKSPNGGKLLVTAGHKIDFSNPLYTLLARNKLTLTNTIEDEVFPDLSLSVSNKTSSYMIRYSTAESYFALYSVQNANPKLINKVDKHACRILRIRFANENSFISLDDGGKLKIWLVNDGDLSVCQTITSEEFYKGSFYSDFDIDTSRQQLTLKTLNRIDCYKLDISKYRKQQKNNLISFIYSEVFSPNQAVPEGDLYRKRTGSERSGIAKPKASRGEYYGSIFLKNGPEQSYSSETRPMSTGVVMEQSGIDSFIIPETDQYETKNGLPDEPSFIGQVSKKSPEIHVNKPGSRFRRQHATIYVGIDFGTSRTKVSFNNESEGRYEPLLFTHLQPKNYVSRDLIDDYAIPSIVRIHQDQMFYGYDAIGGQGKILSFFKQELLLDRDPDSRMMSVCAGFLAYVMTFVKDQICSLTNAGPDDMFVFSVCLPVDRMNNNAIVKRFDKVLMYAKEVMELGCLNNLEEIKKIICSSNTIGETESRTRTAIIPESIAEVLDYCNRKARNQLYALYDFGAGTTDLTIFLYNSLKGQAQIAEAQVVNKGYSYIDRLKNNGVVNASDVRRYYSEIWHEFRIQDTWARAKRKIAGIESMRFFYDITLFGSGGGFNDEIVRDVFKKVPLYHERTNDFIVAKSGISKLEEPIDWDTTKPPYFRYAVSFGLTKKPEETLKSYLLPRDFSIPDRSIRIRTSKEPDVLYPNNSWLGRRK